MGDVMEIVYASDHAFMFCCCVSIYSLMEHQPPDKTVRLHLLIDSSFCAEDERLISFLTARFDRLVLVTHRVREELFEKHDFKGSIWSRATFYRLLLPLLLENTRRCLYLDSDTLIVGDLTALWETDLNGYCLAGVFEDISSISAMTLGSRIPGIETYVNAGVLLMNLDLMRRLDLSEQLLAGSMDTMCLDQDSLNIACYGRIRLLPHKYNAIPGIEYDNPVIMHFRMRDYIRPWKNRRAKGAGRWWEYAGKFAKVYDIEALRDEARWYEKGSISWLYRRCADFDSVYVVGSGSDAQRIARALRLGKCRALKGVLQDEESLPYEPTTLLICASRKREIPVVEEYLSHADGRSQVVSLSRWPVNYYRLAPSMCRQDLAEELLMWEFGVDSHGMTAPAALLELNAVRYPEKEALVECKNGTRRSVSFRELNRMANRMANDLRQSGIARGSHIGLSSSSGSLLMCLAAMLGIMKGGYVAVLDETGEKTANLAALTEESLPCTAPGTELLPDEPVLKAGGRVFTALDLINRSNSLREKTGWSARDMSAVYASVKWYGILELTTALMFGNTTFLYPDTKPEEAIHLLSAGTFSILSMSREMFSHVAYLAESSNVVPTPSTCRMVITENGSETQPEVDLSELNRYCDAERKWRTRFPHIPVNAPEALSFDSAQEEKKKPDAPDVSDRF